MSIRTIATDMQLVIQSATGLGLEDTIIPGNNAYGSYVQLLTGAEVTDDAYGIWINLSNNTVSAVARDSFAKVGVDPSGGTTFIDKIPDLGCSSAGTISASNGGCGGMTYYFPLFIKAGSAIGIAASVNNATVGTLKASVRLFCKPSGIPPRTGTFVRSFGAIAASSSGVPIVPNGSGSKSAFVQLGSALAESLWYWSLGVCCNNSNMTNNTSVWDLYLGDGTNMRSVIVDMIVMPGSLETLAYTCLGQNMLAQIGEKVYSRAGSNSTSPTGMSAIAYGMGG